MQRSQSRSRPPGRFAPPVARSLALVALVASSALVALPAPSAAQASPGYHDERELPAGPVAERARELVDAINSSDPEVLRALVENAFAPAFRDMAPMEQHLAVLGGSHRQSGGFDIYGIRRYDPPRPPGPRGEEHVVIVRNRLTEGWQAFVLTLEEEPPHRIEGLQLVPARPPSDLPSLPPLTREEMVAELRAFVGRLAAADVFSGTVLVARGDEVLFQGAWGEASRRYGVPNRLDTKLNLGSMNKMFTAVAVMQLAEAGKLSLDDPLSKYVGEEWLPKAISDKIRIEHLLTHTSGLGSYFNDTYIESARNRFREIADFQPLVEGETLAFEPGTDWRYSNTGMLLLGPVIEMASGTGYFDYVRKHVYGPAGMSDTDSYDMDAPVENLAMGHTKRGSEWFENTFMHVIRGGPAGGGFSTAPDLLRFARAMQDGTLVSAGSREAMWTPKPELSSPDYGYGFQVGGAPEDRVVGHGGGFPGINSNLDIFVDSGYVSIVLTNVDQGAQPVVQRIQEMIGRLEAAEE
jgi:CubicO group peptidase (beta-lactamase class C family)